MPDPSPPADPAPSILLEGVALSYAGKRVLDGLSLTVRPGEIYALLGGNGAGKSTTLSALLGFATIDAGRILVAGCDPRDDPDAVRRRIAYLPENVALYEHLTGLENADYLLALAGEPRSRPQIEAALTAAGLQQDAWDRRTAGYSKGMRQKVAIAIAWLRAVPVLLLDEPTSGLDPSATAEFNRLLHAVRARGDAVLMVTHDLLSAAEVADQIGFLEDGRIVDEVAAAGPDRFDVRALHARFAAPAAVAA